MTGATVCRMHGGSAPQVKAAAKHRAAKMEAQAEAGRMVARAGVDVDPIEHLLESLYRQAALVEVWGAMVDAIDTMAEEEAASRDEIRGTLGYTEDHDEDSRNELRIIAHDRMMALNYKGESFVHPYVTEYQNALKERARMAKLCIDAGIAERQVAIAEEQGKLVAEVIRKIIEDLGLDASSKKVRTIVGRHLRLVGSEAA